MARSITDLRQDENVTLRTRLERNHRALFNFGVAPEATKARAQKLLAGNGISGETSLFVTLGCGAASFTITNEPIAPFDRAGESLGRRQTVVICHA